MLELGARRRRRRHRRRALLVDLLRLRLEPRDRALLHRYRLLRRRERLRLVRRRVAPPLGVGERGGAALQLALRLGELPGKVLEQSVLESQRLGVVATHRLALALRCRLGRLERRLRLRARELLLGRRRVGAGERRRVRGRLLPPLLLLVAFGGGGGLARRSELGLERTARLGLLSELRLLLAEKGRHLARRAARRHLLLHGGEQLRTEGGEGAAALLGRLRRRLPFGRAQRGELLPRRRQLRHQRPFARRRVRRRTLTRRLDRRRTLRLPQRVRRLELARARRLLL